MHETGSEAGGPAKLTESLIVALHSEWLSEVAWRRQRIHSMSAWLIGGLLVPSLGLVVRVPALEVWMATAFGVAAAGVGWIGVMSIWNHKLIHNELARAVVRLDRALGLYGTVWPAHRSNWGTRPATWEMVPYTILLWGAASLFIFLAVSSCDLENPSNAYWCAGGVSFVLGAAYAVTALHLFWKHEAAREKHEGDKLPGAVLALDV